MGPLLAGCHRTHDWPLVAALVATQPALAAALARNAEARLSAQAAAASMEPDLAQTLTPNQAEGLARLLAALPWAHLAALHALADAAPGQALALSEAALAAGRPNGADGQIRLLEGVQDALLRERYPSGLRARLAEPFGIRERAERPGGCSALSVLREAPRHLDERGLLATAGSQPEAICGGGAERRHDLQLLRAAAAAGAAVRFCAAMAHLDAAPPHLQPPHLQPPLQAEREAGVAPDALAALGCLHVMLAHLAAVPSRYLRLWGVLCSMVGDSGGGADCSGDQGAGPDKGIGDLDQGLEDPGQSGGAWETAAAAVQSTALEAWADDARWRLDLLAQMAPSVQQRRPGRTGAWGWGEALAVLQAEPTALLRMCQLRREFALGGQAARRFALPKAEVAALQLSEWLDACVAGANVDSAVSQLAAGGAESAEDSARPALDFETLRAPLSPVQRLLLCLDVATAAAASPGMCRRLLAQAEALLPEATAHAAAPLALEGATDEHAKSSAAEAALLRPAEALLRTLQRLLVRSGARPLRELVAGVDWRDQDGGRAPGSADAASVLRRQLLARTQAVARLEEAQANAASGRHQFLSGLLHNLAKILAADHVPRDPCAALEAAGLGPGLELEGGDVAQRQGSSALGYEDSPTRPLGAGAPLNFLSAMLTYLAKVGDEVAAVDPAPGEAQDYFALLGARPRTLLPKLVLHWGCADDAASRAREDAELLAFAASAAAASPALQRWVALQAATNPALTALREKSSAGGAVLSSPLGSPHALAAAGRAPGSTPGSAVGSASKSGSRPRSGGSDASVASAPAARRGRRLAWECCMRLRDKRLAAELVLECHGAWDLPRAAQALAMCEAHLAGGEALLPRVRTAAARLRLYADVLAQPGVRLEFKTWQRVHALHMDDPALLVRRLLTSGARRAAAQVALEGRGSQAASERTLPGLRMASAARDGDVTAAGPPVPDALAYEAFAARAAALLGAPVKEGGGLTACIRFLRSLPAVAAVEAGLALGLDALARLPAPWDARLAHLAGRPALLVESLIMAQQFGTAGALMHALPALRSDALLLRYARSAVSFERWASDPPQAHGATPASTPIARGAPGSPFSPSASQHSAGGSQHGTSRASGAVQLLRRAAGALQASGAPALAGPRAGGAQAEGAGAGPGFEAAAAAPAAPDVLTGDPAADEAIRHRHSFATAPNPRILRALLAMASTPDAAAAAALESATGLAAQELAGPRDVAQPDPEPDRDPGKLMNPSNGPPVSSPAGATGGGEPAASLERALEAASVVADAMDFARERLDAADAAADAAAAATRGSSRMRAAGRRAAAEASARVGELRSHVQDFARRVELLQVLLSSLVPASLDDLANDEQVTALVARLAAAEHWALAVYVARRCERDPRDTWERWALALALVARYEDAEARLANAFRARTDAAGGDAASATSEDAARALRAVRALEAAAPVNLGALRKLCSVLQAAAAEDGGASLDAKEFLQVLKTPRQLASAEKAAWGSLAEARMAGRRLALARRLLDRHAPRQLPAFLIRHGYVGAACELLFPVPGSLEGKGGTGTEEATGEPVTDRYGSSEDLLRLCARAGQLRTLQRALAAGGPHGRAALRRLCGLLQDPAFRLDEQPPGIRDGGEAAVAIGSSAPEAATDSGAGSDANSGSGGGAVQDAGQALTEAERLQFVYRCQLQQRLPDEAGLTCVRLAALAPDMPAALMQLENAAVHFDDALAAVQRSPSETAGVHAAEVRMGSAALAQAAMRARLQAVVYRAVAAARAAPPRWAPFGWGPAPAPAPRPRDYNLHEVAPTPAARAEAEQRRLAVAELLLPRDFGLAFRALHAFGEGAPARAYAGAARNLAARGAASELRELLGNVSGTVSDDEWDQVLAAAVAGYAPAERPAGAWLASWAPMEDWAGSDAAAGPALQLVEAMRSRRAQARALLQLGLLLRAADAAAAAGSRSDVQAVAAEAAHRADDGAGAAVASAPIELSRSISRRLSGSAPEPVVHRHRAGSFFARSAPFSCSGEEEERQRLGAILASYGLCERLVKGDGNCQFRALSDQLYGTGAHYAALRQLAVEQLAACSQWYSEFVAGDYHSYLSGMARDGTWGDHLTLQAVADRLGLRIVVLSTFEESPVIEIHPHGGARLDRVLHLSFWAEVHYNSIYGVSDLPREPPKEKLLGSRRLYNLLAL
ncbi:hypothetical protein WJX81_000852 [Elliptochloris bilobata]|uniref:OTU domain-containing protein n=1 Tax=Elliptochloris bilobata TaxID=381761 RepID=A0AAW1S7E5_9CHLO